MLLPRTKIYNLCGQQARGPSVIPLPEADLS